jgi:hypothetical protein
MRLARVMCLAGVIIIALLRCTYYVVLLTCWLEGAWAGQHGCAGASPHVAASTLRRSAGRAE